MKEIGSVDMKEKKKKTRKGTKREKKEKQNLVDRLIDQKNRWVAVK